MSSSALPVSAPADADLLAFARGHSAAANAIHEAVLAALVAESPGEFVAIVTREWPHLLGVDHVVFAWTRNGRAILAADGARRAIEPRLVTRIAERTDAISLRLVDRGHPLFAAKAGEIRSEAVLRLSASGASGLLLLGDRGTVAEETPSATRLLRFLGRATSAMLARWPLP